MTMSWPEAHFACLQLRLTFNHFLVFERGGTTQPMRLFEAIQVFGDTLLQMESIVLQLRTESVVARSRGVAKRGYRR